MNKSNIHDKKNKFLASRRIWQYIIFALIILLAIFLRVYHISADPPLDPGQGQSLSTDPPQYVHYAANKVTFGSWDNFTRTKYIWHIFNLYSPVAYVVFSIFGPGLVQGNMVGVCFNLFSIIFLFWVLRYRIGVPLALLGMFLLAINYEFIKIGRLSYLENIQVLVLLLSFGLIDRMDKWRYAVFLGGFVMAVGVFFCKASSVLSAVGLAVALILYWKYVQRQSLKEISKQLGLFGAGFILVGLVWLIIAYLPTVHQIWDGKISTAFFSRPAGLDSPSMFIFYIYTLFVATKFVLHAPFQFLLALVFMIIIVTRFLKRPQSVSLQELLWPLGILFVFVGVFYWEYRPLRYQVVTSPLLAASTVWFFYLLKEKSIRFKISLKITWAVIIAGSFLFSFFWFSILAQYLYQPSMGLSSFWQILFFAWILSAVTMPICYFILFREKQSKIAKVKSRQTTYHVLIVMVALLCSIINLGLYSSALKNSQYTFKEASREINKILNSKAYVIGTYAPLLTVDAKIRSDTPIWGSDKIPHISERFPATHIVQESNGPLLKILENDYPGIRDGSLFLGHIYVRGFMLELWKLPANFSQLSKTYSESEYENALELLRSGKSELARTKLLQLQQETGGLPIIAEALQGSR